MTRTVAGGSIRGDILKCALTSVDNALEDHIYGGVKFNDAQRKQLKLIFPKGVCDYSKHDIAIADKKK